MNYCDDDGIEETASRFFNPWIGDNYWEGIGSNKFCVLVLGASVYCTHDGNHTYKGEKVERCPHFEECTNGDNQDSSEFNDDCPFPETDSDGDATPLEDYPIYVWSRTMTKFENKMEDRFGEILGGDSIWNHIAFTEYVQYFMDHEDTYPSDLSERDFDAFLETLDELRPDVVVVWGDVVSDALRESEFSVEVNDDDPWDFAWEYDDMLIRFICCAHPASRGHFSNVFPEFANRFEETINISEDGDNDEDDEDDEEEDYNDDEDDEDDDDEDDEDNDDRVYLETANDLLDRLNDLPRKCKNFIVRFKDIDNGDWVQPECWYIDDDQDLILNIYDDGDDHHEFTVNDLMNILTVGTTDDYDNVVEEETPVYIDVNSDDDNYRRPLDEYFRINWKEKRVEIPVRDDDEGYDEDESYEDEDGDDEDEDEDGDEDEDEDGDEDEDEDGDNEDEDEDGDNEVEDEDGDNEVEDENDDDEDNNSGNGIGDNLTLRLLLSNAIKDL